MNKNLRIAILVLIAGGIVFTAYAAQRKPLAPSSTPTVTAGKTDSAPVTSAAQTTPTPYAGNIVRLAWFYKPPDPSQLDLVIKKTDFYILTHKDETARGEIKARGIKAPFSQYLLFSVINDPGDCTDEPNGNQVAFKAGDFCAISQSHPDWFLLDGDGNRIVSRKNTYYMDPGNEGFRAFWLQRARELQETYGWDSIFLDNVEASRVKMLDTNGSLAKYPDDASYQHAVEGFLAYIRQNYFQPRGKPMYANIVSVADEAVWDSYLQYLDGAMVESFATDWSDGYRTQDEWNQQMDQAQHALSQGKTLILVAQGDEADQKLQNLAFASYLLIANGNAFFRYSNSDSYRELWLYENYNLDLGAPLGDRYKYKGGWRRDFAHGYVVVKPQSQEAEIVANP